MLKINSQLDKISIAILKHFKKIKQLLKETLISQFSQEF